MGNAFLNGVETSQEEASCLLLSIPITQMSQEVIFINTAPTEERTFVLKSVCDPIDTGTQCVCNDPFIP